MPIGALDVTRGLPDVLQCCKDPRLELLIHLYMAVGLLIVVGHVYEGHQVPPRLIVCVQGAKRVGLDLRSTASLRSNTPTRATQPCMACLAQAHHHRVM